MGDTGRLRSVEKTKLMVMTALMAVIISVCSWISIPLIVPFTLQTFAIFFALILLGGAYGTLSICIYILLGVIGIPVFSGFKSGAAVIVGPTGGYIVGFVFSGLLFILMTKLFGDRKIIVIISMVLGLLVCYLIGTLWFMYVYAGTESAGSFGEVLSLCVIPFIIPDICKMILAYIMAGLVKKAIR
ncbi:MAG: biotin transporter BioY [Lachnospiraceae bacterium]|nr:biotin transporter BioY [Lachnospiraceae bacterium]